MDFRDVVHATQSQMLQFGGENVFRVELSVHLVHLPQIKPLPLQTGRLR
jgi:hypothetical protein